MNKKYLAAATLVALAGLYLGCTSPSTVVETAKNAADPRVPAGNATSTTFSKADVTGYWMLDDRGHAAFRQKADGSVVGQTMGDYPISDGTFSNGTLTFKGDNRDWTGKVSDDGATMVLSYIDHRYNATGSYNCTRLF